jgi:hypothetical protein
MDIQNLASNCETGAVIIPGTTSKIYAVCACDILTFPGFVTTTGPGDKLILDGDIVLKATKKFAEINITPDTGKIDHELVGVRGSKSYNNKFGFKVAKSLLSDEWFNENGNGCAVLIVETKDGARRVIGTDKIPAFFETATGTSGDAQDSEAMWTGSVMDTVGKVAPYYEGTIDLTP